MAYTSNSESKDRYDVFLSFRGLDTRKSFADHLNEALKRNGFRTFRDDDDIKRGSYIKSELQKAIRNSWMSIIVLSKNYANSTACLFELQTILQHWKKSSEHYYSILPVFYEVDPSEITKQAENLSCFFPKNKATGEEVKGWSAALKEVPSVAGMVSNGYEARFIEEIVGEVKRRLDLKTKTVIGVCEARNDCNSRLSMNSKSLQLCTEGLGFESAEMCSGWYNKISMTRNTTGELRRSRSTGRTFPTPISSIRRTFPPPISRRTFPPPISSIGNRVCFKSDRNEGSLVLKAISMPTQEFLHARREDGRLKLQLYTSDEEVFEDDEEEEEEDVGDE